MLSAAGFVLAFPQPDLSALAWVTLVPLLLAVRRRSPRTAFSLGYAWGIAAYGGVLWWITTFGAAVWLLAAAFAAVFPAVAMVAVNRVEGAHDGPWTFVWIASIWTAVEFLRSQGPLGFPWALLGASQHRAIPIIQIASITGIYGVTFLVALANGALYALVTRRAALLPAGGTALVVAGVIVWGMTAVRAPIPQAFLAAAVQPNAPTRPGLGSANAPYDLAVLGRLTNEAARRGAALVLWPETASPRDVLGPGGTLATIRRWAQENHVSVIATSLEGGRTNSAFSIGSSGALTGRYDKVRLVPFAEVGEQAGTGVSVLPTPQGRIGIAICFESTFPEIARRAVADGATLLAVLTNDAWFDGRTAPAQHAAVAPFRAVEEGRYLIRAANQGITAIIDPRGRTLAALPLGVRGVVIAPVAPLHARTPYAMIGDAFGWAVTLAAAALVWPHAGSPATSAIRTPAFTRLLIDSALPLAVLVGVARLSGPDRAAAFPPAGTGLPLPLLAVLATTGLLSVRRSRADLGFRLRGFVPVVVLGLGFVGALALVARRAFGSQGMMVDLAAPPGGWWVGTAVQVLAVGLPLEWWLRGLVFADAAAWQGWKTAVVWSGLLGAIAASPRGAEAVAWALCAGGALGLLRARWAQVPALAVVHGAGGVLLGFLLAPW